MKIQNKVIVSRLKYDHTENCRIGWQPLPLLVRTRCGSTRHVIQSIPNHWPTTKGTSWEYKVNWKGWDAKNITWEAEENMVKANDLVKQYWEEIAGWPMARKKKLWNKVGEASVYFVAYWEKSQRNASFYIRVLGIFERFPKDDWRRMCCKWIGQVMLRCGYCCASAAPWQAGVAVSSSKMSARSSITFSLICTEWLFVHLLYDIMMFIYSGVTQICTVCCSVLLHYAYIVLHPSQCSFQIYFPCVLFQSPPPFFCQIEWWWMSWWWIEIDFPTTTPP